jgi:hypothetical protein
VTALPPALLQPSEGENISTAAMLEQSMATNIPAMPSILELDGRRWLDYFV